MAELLVRHATAENEAELLAEAAQSTVRSMRSKFTARENPTPVTQQSANTIKLHPTRWVNATEHAALIASRMLVEYLDGARPSDDTFVTALLGEAETSLQTLTEQRGLREELPKLDRAALAALLEAMRARKPAELDEARPAPQPELPPLAEERSLPKTLRGLDAEIRRACRELASRDLELGRLANVILKSRVWRELGYKTPEQYATERVGLSLSSLQHRMTLARRVARYPELGHALDDGLIGYEAAMLISGVLGFGASHELVRSWIERAQKRTAKHLREEIDAVRVAVAYDPNTSRFPPSAEDIEAVQALERKIQSGELVRSYYLAGLPGPQMSVTLIPDDACSGRRRPLRLNLSVDVYGHWRNIEAEFRRVVGMEYSFVGFLCASLWNTWLPFLEIWDDKWKDIFQRERHKCSSPVCERRDVTLHHLRYPEHPGEEKPEDLTGPCSWCHLKGVHGGRLRARGHAQALTWEIGAEPLLIVRNREKIALS